MNGVSLHAELAGLDFGNRCKVCAYLSTLAAADREDWESEFALPVESVSNSAFVRAFRRRDVNITEASIRRHRGNHARVR